MITPEERDLITRLYERLEQAAGQPRDRDAEALIAQLVRGNPAAPYLLTQMALVHEHALRGAQNRIEELERDLEAAKDGSGERPNSFLGGLLSGTAWARKEPAGSVPRPGPRPGAITLPREPMVSGSPWSGRGSVPAAGPQVYAARGPSFLQSALTTAAGVAGGMMLGNMLANMLSHNSGSPVAAAAAEAHPAEQKTADAPAASPWETAHDNDHPAATDEPPHEADTAQHAEPADHPFDTAQSDPFDGGGDAGFGGGGDSDVA